MKEDKLDKDIAASLRKKLVEASVPYEMGAWEGFQKKRAAKKLKNITYWVSGIAASLLLLAVGLTSVDFSQNDEVETLQVQIAESDNSMDTIEQEFPSTEFPEQDLLTDSSANTQKESNSDQSVRDSKWLAKTPDPSNPQPKSNDKKANALVTDSELKSAKNEVKVSPDLPVVGNDNKLAQGKENSNVKQPLLPAKPKEEENTALIQSPLIAKTEEPTKLPSVVSEDTLASNTNEKALNKDVFIAESDFPDIPQDKTTVGLGMGVSPGFGAIQNDNQVATASTIGLGMLVDINLPGKFTLGSGLGLNYLSQNAKEESTVMSFGNSYPQTEKLEVRQMQVEVPVFVKYPLTRSNSVSIQAGFSNYYALNETASQENTVARQVAVYNSDAFGASSLSLRQQDVTESTSLESKSGKFYPFATLNFGLNLRVLETEGANYVIMPFYNYQVKQISGYGDTYGLFGASFKMNFGGK